MPRAGWHREQIKAAIRIRGATLTDLALRHGYAESAVRMVFIRPSPTIERIVAEFLGVPPRTYGHPAIAPAVPQAAWPGAEQNLLGADPGVIVKTQHEG